MQPIAQDSRMLPRLVRLAVPIMLTNLLQMAYNLVDAWFLGRLSAAAVSAPALLINPRSNPLHKKSLADMKQYHDGNGDQHRTCSK